MAIDNRQPFRTPDPGRTLDRNELIVPLAGEEDRRLREIERNIDLANKSITMSGGSVSIGTTGGTGSTGDLLGIGEVYPSFPISISLQSSTNVRMWFDETDYMGLGAGTLLIPGGVSFMTLINPADPGTVMAVTTSNPYEAGTRSSVPVAGGLVFVGGPKAEFSNYADELRYLNLSTGVWTALTGSSDVFGNDVWWSNNKSWFFTSTGAVIATGYIGEAGMVSLSLTTDLPDYGYEFSTRWGQYRVGFGHEYVQVRRTGYGGLYSSYSHVYHRVNNDSSPWTQIYTGLINSSDTTVGTDGSLWWMEVSPDLGPNGPIWYLKKMDYTGTTMQYTMGSVGRTPSVVTGISALAGGMLVASGYYQDLDDNYRYGLWAVGPAATQLVWSLPYSSSTTGISISVPAVRSDGAVAILYKPESGAPKLTVLQLT